MACQSGGSGWFEVWLVVIGAVLGFALSIITIIVNKVIDKHGKMRLFYRLVYQKSTGKKAGIESGVYETCLIIPLYMDEECSQREIKNEANVPKCPICGSTDLKKLSAINRGVSFGVFGFASNKIGKTYECQKCKATF